jgi:hypothetical protein
MREGVVSSSFFRVDGADSETGHETFLVLRAKSKPHAERLARKQGLLITSIRIAKPADWEETPHKAAPATAIEVDITRPAMDKPEVPTQNLSPSPALAPLPGPSQLSRASAPSAIASGATTIVLCAVGGALIVGGVLAMALALWPDDGVRNELQQIDFRLHELSQTVLGSMLVLGGLIVFVLTAVIAWKRTSDE